MNKRIRKKQEKQRKQLEMKWLLDMAVAIDTAIQEYWQWREEMERRYVELYAEEIARRITLFTAHGKAKVQLSHILQTELPTIP